MCVLSAVIDSGAQQWPWSGYQGITQSPITIEIPKLPTAEEWAAFRELCEKARKFDELTGQADCEKPELVAWMREVDARLEDLEAEKPRTADEFLAEVKAELERISAK